MPHAHGRGIPVTSISGQIAVTFMFGAVIGVMFWAVKQKRAQIQYNLDRFEARVAEAQQWLLKSHEAHPDRPSVSPSSGTYEFLYPYGRKHFSGTIYLSFEKASQGWAVHGAGQNRHGEFRILEGRVSHDGSVWWIQLGREARRTLSTGKFDFKTNSFQGNWTQTGKGMSGTYESFRLQE
jgi:hypothetical protein